MFEDNHGLEKALQEISNPESFEREFNKANDSSSATDELTQIRAEKAVYENN